MKNLSVDMDPGTELAAVNEIVRGVAVKRCHIDSNRSLDLWTSFAEAEDDGIRASASMAFPSVQCLVFRTCRLHVGALEHYRVFAHQELLRFSAWRKPPWLGNTWGCWWARLASTADE